MNISISKITVRRPFFRRLSIPFWIIDSGKLGPVLLITAAQHGNELQGSVAIYRFINEYADTVTSGRVILVPFCNIPAVRQHRPHLNMRIGQVYGDDRGHNMNRQWSGLHKGNSTKRIATAIYETCGKDATHVLDLHSWQKHNSPAILLHGVPKHRELAQRLGVQFIDMRPISEKTLAGKFCTDGRIGITYESAGQYDIDDEQVSLALNVIRNMIYAIGVSGGQRSEDRGRKSEVGGRKSEVGGRKSEVGGQRSGEEESVGKGECEKGECGRKSEVTLRAMEDIAVIFSDKSTVQEVVAPVAGLFMPKALKLGEEVAQDQELGVILVENLLESIIIRTPVAGYLKRFGVSRPDCDIDMASFHSYVNKRDVLAVVVN